MKQQTQWVLYILLIPLIMVVFYGIFNAGRPDSLFRLFIPDPAYDLTVTLGFGVAIAVIAIALFAGRTPSPLKNLLDLNLEHIATLRGQGMSDGQIADSFLKELGSSRGLMHWFVRRRVLHHLSRMEGER